MKDWIKENYKLIIRTGQIVIAVMVILGFIEGVITGQYLYSFEFLILGLAGIFIWKYVVILVLRMNKIL